MTIRRTGSIYRILHNAAYTNAGVDADDWLPNKLLNDAADPAALWADYLTNDGAGDLLEDGLSILTTSGSLMTPYGLFEVIAAGSLDQSKVDFAIAFLNAIGNMSGGALADMANDLTGPLGDLADLLSQLPEALRNPLDMPTPFEPILPEWLTPAQNAFGDAPTQASPIIIDIDGANGVEATTFNAATTTTFFDIDNDGFVEQTAWVGAGDGLLARDLDDSGTIDSAAELFGSATVDGFALLAAMDTNGDLRIDAQDADFDELLIWVDANADAVSQGSELQALSYWNIASISLDAVTAGSGTINGNPVSHTSTVTLTNGTTQAAADVWFVHDNANTALCWRLYP